MLDDKRIMEIRCQLKDRNHCNDCRADFYNCATEYIPDLLADRDELLAKVKALEARIVELTTPWRKEESDGA